MIDCCAQAIRATKRAEQDRSMAVAHALTDIGRLG
jgi:hypothetical protein